jgi:hypothetical protein
MWAIALRMMKATPCRRNAPNDVLNTSLSWMVSCVFTEIAIGFLQS